MRIAVAIIAAAFLSNASAQSNNLFYPSPLGIILSAGKLMYDHDSNREHLVTVKSSGKTEAEARANAFQLAVEYTVGQLVLSEQEVSNNQVVRNDTIQYSSGYVSRYHVKNKELDSGNVVLVTDVYVKQSKISHRLVNHSTDKSRVDSKNLAAQVRTAVDQTRTGDRVLKTVLNDYPLRAFNITHKDVYVERNNRSLDMVIPITLTWNVEYLQSVGEALQAVNEGVENRDRKHAYRLVSRLPGLFSRTYDVWTADYKRYALFNDTFSVVGIKTQIFDESGKVLIEKCVEPQHSLTSFFSNQIIIDGRSKLEHKLTFEGLSEEKLDGMSRISITAVRQCKEVLVARR